MNRETGNRYQQGAPQMPKWNFVAMGQVGLTGWTRVAAKPLAQAVAAGPDGPRRRSCR
jgi:hypothetical protein